MTNKEAHKRYDPGFFQLLFDIVDRHYRLRSYTSQFDIIGLSDDLEHLHDYGKVHRDLYSKLREKAWYVVTPCPWALPCWKYQEIQMIASSQIKRYFSYLLGKSFWMLCSEITNADYQAYQI